MIQDNKAVSEGASSELISSNQITETDQEESFNGMTSAQSFKRLLIDMKNQLLIMKRDNDILTNPPDCNLKLNDLLVAQPERSIANDYLRQKLETVSGD